MTEIEKLLKMNYEHVCDYLKNKYGNIPKDYFVDETMTKKNTRYNKRERRFVYSSYWWR